MFHEGQQLGEYSLIEKLGRGGFGEVWLAETEDELYAVKLPHKDQVDWKQITQEIGLWTLCGKHPNLMPLVGARNFNGQIAIISEYAPDGSLEDLLKAKGKLSVDEAVEMTIGILEGLHHLHESGIIHRDLKPANILLDGKTPRLTDFGISRIISADSLSETIAGTFAYMAPECFDGKRNVQTDIWSVGVILYQMIMGKRPFAQKEQTALVAAIIMREPEHLPDFISLELQNIVSKALAKNLVARYQTASGIYQDLKLIFEGFSELETILVESPNKIATVDDIRETVTINSQISPDLRLIPYLKGDKWGFCDEHKNIWIKPIYEDFDEYMVGVFDDVKGLAKVNRNGKYGFINKFGQEVIPIKYENVGEFYNDLVDAKLNGKWGFINSSGEEVIQLKYDYVDDFSKGIAEAKLDEKYGCIDLNGQVIIPLKYERIWIFNHLNFVRVELNGKCGIFNKSGEEIIAPKYDRTYADGRSK